MIDIPLGYKQTEVGVIPEDWEVVSLMSIAASPLQNGVFFKPTQKGAGVKLINVGDLYNRIPIDSDSLELFDATSKEIQRYKVESNDLFFTRSSIVPSGIAQCNIYLEETAESVVFDSHVIRFRPDVNKVVATYLFRYCVGAASRKYLIANGKSGTMTTIDQRTLGSCPVALPARAEQEAIAAALSDADALIESLEQLIAKKRRIKQGAMQQLLTGKKRLPGFATLPGYKQTEVGVIPEDWQTPSLGSLTVLMTNGFVGTATRHYAGNENGILYIQGYNVEENSFNFHGVKFVTEEFHRAHLRSCLRGGDLLTVQTGDVGLTTIVPESLAGSNCHALIISRFDHKRIFPAFISYYLNSKPGRSRLRLIEIGTTMKHLNVGDVLQFVVPLPPTKAEQTAIATSLSDMDTELAALEAKLAKARNIKQGMMQELLTGRIRLV